MDGTLNASSSAARLRLLVMGFVFAGCAAPGTVQADDVPSIAASIPASIPASATVAEPHLPAARGGLRLLQLVHGKEPAVGLRGILERELRDLNAFEAFLPEGGEYRLEMTITDVRQDHRQRGGRAGESPDRLEVTLSATCRWIRGETTLLDVPLELVGDVPVDSAPTRNEIRTTLNGLLREAGQRAFGELYERHVREGGRADGDSPPEAGTRVP